MRNWKTILIFVLIFALLGGAYLFIENYDPAPSAPTETPVPLIPLLTLDVSNINQIDVQNTAQGFSFIRTETAWVVKNEPTIEIYPSRVESLVYSAASLSADALIATNAEDLAPYGLDKPQSKISLLMQDASTITFSIGNQTPALDGYYCYLSESRDIYKISTSLGSQFLSPLSAFRVMTISALNATDIRSITIKKENTAFQLQYEAPPEGAYPGAISTWHILSPIQRDADDKLVQEKLLTPLSMLTAHDVAADNPTDLSLFGFSGDSVEIKTETETVRFSVGQKDGMSYILPEGKTAVYSMGAGTLSFMTVTPFDVLEKMTNLISIDTVETIDISLSGQHFILRIEHSGDTMQYFVNDTPCKEEAFKAIYVELSALSVDGMLSAPPALETISPACSIVYTLTDASAVTLSYYPYDSLNYAVSENGECTFYIKKTKLSQLAEKLQGLLDNPQG